MEVGRSKKEEGPPGEDRGKNQEQGRSNRLHELGQLRKS